MNLWYRYTSPATKWVAALPSLGNLLLYFPHSAGDTYKRTLAIDRAAEETCRECENTLYRPKVFISAPDNLMVIQPSTGKPAQLSLRILAQSQLRTSVCVSDNTLIAEHQGQNTPASLASRRVESRSCKGLCAKRRATVDIFWNKQSVSATLLRPLDLYCREVKQQRAELQVGKPLIRTCFMKTKKAGNALLIAVCALVFMAVCAGCSSGGTTPADDLTMSGVTNAAEYVDMYYFYEELCGSCTADAVEAFYSILREKVPYEEREQYPHRLHTNNVYEQQGRPIWEQVTDAMGLDRESLQMPLLIVGGRAFQGHENIANNIREAFLTACEDMFVYKRVYNPATRKTGKQLFDDYAIDPDHVTLVYYYRITCSECAKTKPLIDELPASIMVNGENVPLDIIRINTRSGNNGDRIAAFFEAYNVPDEDRRVPIVFFSDSYLVGVDSIKAGIFDKLAEVPETWRPLIPKTVK
ncbi:MAG: glycoside hydrolase family 95 protein [Treponema sp.]|nr:glycoside hydrolase family 95 protein [Treponema sp.]